MAQISRGTVGKSVCRVGGLFFAALLIFAARLGAAEPKASAEPAEPAFGPIISRRVFDSNGEDPQNSMIDLDTGKLFNWPEIGGKISDWEAFVRGIRTNGVDLIGDASGKSFNTVDMVMVPTEAVFEIITVKSVLNDVRLNGPLSEAVIKSADKLPATYLFRTKAGTRGVLEVLRFDENLTSMEIRYKLAPLTVHRTDKASSASARDGK